MLGDKLFRVEVQVVEGLTIDAILGRDFLRKYGCVVNMDSGTLYIKNGGVTLQMVEDKGVQQIARVSLSLSGAVTLPAASEWR